LKSDIKIFYQRSLWILTIAFVLVTALQGISGNWITFFLVWPGGNFGNTFVMAMVKLSSYHRIAGFFEAGISILILFFAFLSKSSIYVRAFAVLGLIMMALAATGGILYVTSDYQDRMALGQMADASVGVVGTYLIQLFFMNKTPRFPWNRQEAN
jgi:hypothetical protein